MIEYIPDVTSKEEIMIMLLGISPFESLPDEILTISEPEITITPKEKLHPKYRQHLSSCKAREMGNHLSEEQYIHLISQPCTYCNNKATGVDRIDSNISYIPDNCQPCCGKCNMMKYTHREQDFLNHVVRIYEKMNKAI